MSYKPIPLPHRRDLNDEDALRTARAFLELMRQRHTVRDYSGRAVSEELIKTCIAAAGTAPSGANQQPWHFAAISNPDLKLQIRQAAEVEEQKFYEGSGGDAWLAALEPIGTSANKPHLTDAPWLIVIFAQRYGQHEDGSRYKHYYVSESVGIATGMLITALHQAGLACLTHTPNPMGFLNEICGRPKNEKPVMILTVGHAAQHATVPASATKKKTLDEILSVFREDEL